MIWRAGSEFWLISLLDLRTFGLHLVLKYGTASLEHQYFRSFHCNVCGKLSLH